MLIKDIDIIPSDQWFKDRIGKKVFRTKSTCKCETCERVFNDGIIISDEFHAEYLNDCESEMGLFYFDSIGERDAFQLKLADI